LFLETEKGIFEAILAGKLDLKSSPWPSISTGAKDLISRMLMMEPKKRITAAEALGEYMTVIRLTDFE
jgi:calcium-dependent protein kinase